jgi:uncharacterized membrane protein
MESTGRTLAKTLSYRAIAALVTGGIAWAFTGEPKVAILIGGADGLAKMAAYYFHERAWNRVAFGRGATPEYQI